MNMKFYFFLLLLFLSSSSFSQQKFSKEFNLTTDNDLYISKAKDRYYSNGIFFTYRYLTSDFKKLDKKIIEIEIGHHIYTPYKSTILNVNLHDRPFAGYMYGNFGIARVYKNKTILKNNIQFGVVGKIAFGKELQEAIHTIYNFTSLTYVAYDATIQGSLFDKESPVTFNPKSIRFDFEIGYKFTTERWNFGYSYHFHSNKINGLKNNKGNDYGRLFFSYLFR